MAVLTDYIIAKRATMQPSATTKAPAHGFGFGLPSRGQAPLTKSRRSASADPATIDRSAALQSVSDTKPQISSGICFDQDLPAVF